MKESFLHKFSVSFSEWIDNLLCSENECFENRTGFFYPKEDYSYPSNFTAYSSPFKQFVHSKSSGANHISGVFIGGTFYPRESGIKVDHSEGRIFVDHSQIPSGNPSGHFPVKKFNIYFGGEFFENILFENNWINNKRFGLQPNSGIEPYSYAAPACFIDVVSSRNEAFSLGGMQSSNFKVRTVVVAENKYEMDGCVSFLTDQKDACIPLIGMEDAALNEWGDIKEKFSGVYDYGQVSAGKPLMIIKSVSSANLQNKIGTNANSSFWTSLVDMEIYFPRYPNI